MTGEGDMDGAADWYWKRIRAADCDAIRPIGNGRAMLRP
jgi:hypothetical protein